MRHTKKALVSTVVLALLALVSVALADTNIGSIGEGTGQYKRPQGVAVDNSNGTLYVADTGNNRIDVFDSAGNFLRTFGWGVVAAGPGNKPQNERQQVTVSASGGSFALMPVGEAFVTGATSDKPVRPSTPISFDASAAAVQSALEAIPALTSGSVAVSGPTGGPWTVEFKGAFADTDLYRMQGLPDGLTGGAASVTVTTLQEGAAYEICDVAAGDVCRAGQPGVSGGEISPQAVVVDNDPSSASYRSVYVFDGLNQSYRLSGGDPIVDDVFEISMRVQKFDPAGNFVLTFGDGVNQDTGGDVCTAASGDTCTAGVKGSAAGQFDQADDPIAVGPGGTVHVAGDDRLQKFTPGGELISGISFAPGEVDNPRGLAVDSTGDFYVGTLSSIDAVRKYDSAGNFLFSIPASLNNSSLAVDSLDNLFVADSQIVRSIFEYDANGNPLRTIYGEREHRADAIAPYSSATGDIFVADADSAQGGVFHLAFPPPGPVVLPFAGHTTAGPVGNTKAFLNAKINPEGDATQYHFEYVDDATYQQTGGFGAAKSTASQPLGGDFELHPVQTAVGCVTPEAPTPQPSCLTPETLYHFRAVANSAAGEDIGPEATFTTRPPLEFPAIWTTEVGSDGARLGAEVNPLGVPASGYFEYVDEASFQQSGFDAALKAPDVEGGEDSIDFGSGEQPVTVGAQAYPLVPGTTYRYRLSAVTPFGPVIGPQGTFTTFKRAQFGACAANDGFRIGPGALLADCRAYEMVSPVNKGNSDISTLFTITGYRANLDRSARSGEKLTYSSATPFGDAQSAPYTSQYLAHRDPITGWASYSISPPRVGASITNMLDTQFKVFSEDLSYGWLLHDTEQPEPPLDPESIRGFDNLYRRDNGNDTYRAQCPTEPPNPDSKVFRPELQGVSADGTLTAFHVDAKLLPEASGKAGIQQVYGCAAGVLRLISRLPSGAAAATGAWTGTSNTGDDRLSLVGGAISADGSRVVWSARQNDPGPLYLRENAKAEQSKVQAGECTEVANACTFEISSEPAQFWAASSDGSTVIYARGGDLYEFDVDKAKAGEEGSTLIATQIVGVMGASADASHIYLVSRAALSEVPNSEGEKATAGQPNLYLREADGETSFIAALSEDDTRLNPAGSTTTPVLTPLAIPPLKRSSRVAPDGLHAAFTSSASPTGYDNTDANSGKADAEVYLYDAEAAELICASCNPSGARPAGAIVGKAEQDFWAAAQIPGWINQLQASRALSENGSRLFFESSDALVLHDTNGAQDVYQWEAPGSGDCTGQSGAFSPANRGCISLVSSGENGQVSEFVDAAADGSDVFFKTAAGLLPQDNGLIDIYDARVGGGFPPEPSPPAACEGEACQPPLAPPNDPTPASSAFQGGGNVVEKAVKKKQKKKHKKKHKSKHHRAASHNRGGHK